MKQKQIEYWRGAIEDGRKYMKTRHKTWRRLLKTYELDFDVPGLDEDKIVKISRMYPLARQIIASVSFNYPHVFLIHSFFVSKVFKVIIKYSFDY